MTDFDAIRLDSIYGIIGIPAEVTTRAGQEKTLTVIDRTAGVEVSLGSIFAPTVKPVAAVRMTDLAANNLSLADVDEGQIEFNGSRWRIANYLLRPGLGGESSGEAFLLLSDENLDE